MPADPIPLWPLGAPGSPHGEGPAERAAEQPTLTPYLLDDAAVHPLVVVCPGGGYGHRAAHESGPVAEWCNRIGLHAAVLDYRVRPFRYPIPQLDAARAMRLVRHHADDWRVDPARVGILGFSAGGHLAGSIAVHHDLGDPSAEDVIDRHPCRPDAAILCYPVVSFRPWGHKGSRNNLLDGDAGRQPELEQRLSLETQVTRHVPPVFLWHTAEDGGVPVQNSLRFAEACARHDVPVSLHVYPHGRHGIGLASEHPTAARTWTDQCEAWFRDLGW